jgi:ribosome-associated heat shock protein Hsp15
VSDGRQRIDRWLWNARVVRTRSAAAALVIAGHVRVNGNRVVAPGRDVKCGDVVTVVLNGGVRVLKVIGMSLRRGDAAAAALIFEELSKTADKAPVTRGPAGPVPAAEDPSDQISAPSRRGRRHGTEND